jgi:DNA-binding transcriptional ArsR family regulator
MVKQNHLDAVFAALADPTRRAILSRLAEGEATVGELAAPLPMSGPAVSKHLKVLEAADLITRRRDGRVHRLGFNGKAMADAAAWITHYRHFWENQFDALAQYLTETEEDPS